MDTRARSRAVAAHKVAQALRLRDFRNSIPDTNAEGSHVVIPALPDDTMGEFFAQARAAKGTIYIALLEGDDLTVVGLSPLHRARHATPPDEDDDCPIYGHTEVQMLIEYLRRRRRPLTIYEAPCRVLVELVDDAQDMPVVTV